MTTSEVRVEVGGSSMPIVIASPESGGPLPTVLVAHHRGGVDEFTRYVIGRLAEVGLVAAAPNFYHRRPDGEDPVTSMGYLKDGELVADMEATLQHLLGSPSVNNDAIGIVGHCLGGRTAYLGLVTNPIYKAAVLLYHGNIFESRDAGPAPFERTEHIHCPILGFFGRDDPNPSPAMVERLDAELVRQGIRYEFHTYDATGHAFQDFTNPRMYREPASSDAWPRLLAFLNHELGASGPR